MFVLYLIEVFIFEHDSPIRCFSTFCRMVAALALGMCPRDLVRFLSVFLSKACSDGEGGKRASNWMPLILVM